MNIVTVTQTVAEFRNSQTVFTDGMKKAVEGMADSDTVRVTKRVTGFGTFFVSVEK
jgi:hypothetical protein